MCEKCGTMGNALRFGLTREVKDATAATAVSNVAWYGRLDFDDKREWECATRGLIAAPDHLEILDADGGVVWSQKAYEFVRDAEAPASANPSLWEDTRNNHAYGLFRVVDGIYQVRGYDMANLTLIEGKRGWIVYDCTMTVECAAAALALANERLGERPVTAVLISHSHVDHYGGIKGLIREEDAASASTPIEEQLAGNKVPIIVPPDFTLHVVSENLYAGPAMARRAAYQYGGYLPKGPYGSLAMGIGCGQSAGNTSFIRPSYEVPATGTELVVDGVRMVFQLTPGTEAPTEMNTWFPELRALWIAENCTGTLHNLYTLRGAQVRDGNAWANTVQGTSDVRDNMTIEMLWDYLGIALDKDAVADADMRINVRLTDTGETFLLRVVHGALLHFAGMQDDSADVTLAGPKVAMFALMGKDLAQLRRHVRATGDEAALERFMASIHVSRGIPAFNIVEP